VVHLHGAITVDEDKRAALVEKRGREGDAELDRRDRKASLLVQVFGVEARDVYLAALEIAGLLELVPDRLDPGRVLHQLAVMRPVPFSIEVAFPDKGRRQREPPRSLSQDLLDNDHRLRSAESAKRRLRRLVRAAHTTRRLHGRQVIGVVAMKQRPPHDRLREIQAPAAVGVEPQPSCLNATVGSECGGVARQVRMAFARQCHVERARETHSNGAPGLPRAERRNRSPGVGLHLFAAERASHAKALDRHLMTREPEHASHDVLGFRRVLSRRVQRNRAALVDPGDGCVGLKVEMLLAANGKLPFEAERAGGKGRHVAACETQLVGQVAPGLNRLFDRQNRGQRLVLDTNAIGHRPRVVEGIRQNPRHGLSVEHHLGREQRLVVTIWPRISFSRDVGTSENGGNARFLKSRGDVKRRHDRVSVRCRDWPRVQKVREAPRKVVRVECGTGHVTNGTLVGNRLAGHHAACSHQNFSSSFFETSSRYSRDPR
jgi:hypothetical protein